MIQVTCIVDLSYFPFDKQACYYEVNSWSYDSHAVILHPWTNTIRLHNDHHHQWEVTNTSSFVTRIQSDDGAVFHTVKYNVYLRRKPNYYMTSIVVPCTILSILSLLMFCLPPEGGDKLSVGITILVAFTVFQLMIAGIMPRASDQTPLLCEYSLYCLSEYMRDQIGNIDNLFVFLFLFQLTMCLW